MFGSILKRMDRRIIMGLFSKFERVPKPVKTVSQKKTFEEIVENAIDNQIRIANGERLTNGKRNKDGKEGMIPSWYNEEKKAMYPKIVIYPLYGGEGFKMDKERYKQLLKDLKQNWRSDDDFQAQLKEVKEKMDSANEKRLQTMRTN